MKILSTIAFHYKEGKLDILRKTLATQPSLAEAVHVVLTTNTDKPVELANILSIAPANSTNFNFSIVSFPTLPHPWLLTWAHKVIFTERAVDQTYSHFLFSEDDIEITPSNIEYWLATRERLRPFGLYPSFLRVEWSDHKKSWVSSDMTAPIDLAKCPRISSVSGDCLFINAPNPYQGMFFYDRELMSEHMMSDTFDINRYGHIETIDKFPGWPGGGVAERANYALTFSSPPPGFVSRNAVTIYPKYRVVDPRCFVHHLSNVFAHTTDENGFGSVPLSNLIYGE